MENKDHQQHTHSLHTGHPQVPLDTVELIKKGDEHAVIGEHDHMPKPEHPKHEDHQLPSI